MQDEFLTPAQVATELCISLSTVYGLIHAGELPAVNLSVRAGGKALYRIKRKCVSEFVSRRLVHSPVVLQTRSRVRHAHSQVTIPNHLRL
jgi:excisionase family DNA binding protein